MIEDLFEYFMSIMDTFNLIVNENIKLKATSWAHSPVTCTVKYFMVIMDNLNLIFNEIIK